MTLNNQRPAKAILQNNGAEIVCSGNWVTGKIAAITKEFKYLKYAAAAKAIIKAEDIQTMDTAGAWMLLDLVTTLNAAEKKVSITGLRKEYEPLISLIASEKDKVAPPPPPEQYNWIYKVGEFTVNKFIQIIDFLAFYGELFLEMFYVFLHPKKMQLKSFLHTIDMAGFRALPIIGLLLFLIGAVLAYQTGIQLKEYGAGTYIVSLIGIAILQEFGPLITAVILAGRTGAAFTSQLGTMKVNQEIDALRTMGLSVMNMLVIPRFFALLIVLPLLTIWADFFGMLGAMIMSKRVLEISYWDFFYHIPQDIKLSTYVIGMIKAPVFAVIISTVGCFQGFEVKMSAESIGQQTTKSVVQAIFLIIIVDSIFTIAFGW